MGFLVYGKTVAWLDTSLRYIQYAHTIDKVEFTWNERKRKTNLQDHGLDFVDCHLVFDGLTFTFQDDRFHYGEERFVTLGLLAGIPVSIVHLETENEIRIISFRKATKRETAIHFANLV